MLTDSYVTKIGLLCYRRTPLLLFRTPMLPKQDSYVTIGLLCYRKLYLFNYCGCRKVITCFKRADLGQRGKLRGIRKEIGRLQPGYQSRLSASTFYNLIFTFKIKTNVQCIYSQLASYLYIKANTKKPKRDKYTWLGWLGHPRITRQMTKHQQKKMEWQGVFQGRYAFIWDIFTKNIAS